MSEREVERMPTMYRKKKIDWVIENMKMLFGGESGGGGNSSETREVGQQDVKSKRN